MEKMKAIFFKDSNKKIETAICIIIMLVIVMISFKYIFKEEKLVSKVKTDSEKETNVKEDNLENKIQNILNEIAGVTDSKVLITYKETSSKEMVYETKVSKDETNETTEKNIAYEEIDGDKKPIIKSNISPKAEGVIVVAKGIETEQSKLEIIKAISALLDVPTYKIQIFKK